VEVGVVWPFPKRLIEWREPDGFVRITRAFAESHTTPWARPLLVVLVLGVLLVPWYLARFNPAKGPVSFPAALCLGLFLGLFLVYCVPLLNRLCSSTVRMFSNGLVRVRGQEFTRLTWKEVTSHYWKQTDGFHTLALVTNRGQTILFGAPDETTRRQAEEVLAHVGVPDSPDAPVKEPDTRAPTRCLP
jgi:hypothetical protein